MRRPKFFLLPCRMQPLLILSLSGRAALNDTHSSARSRAGLCPARGHRREGRSHHRFGNRRHSSGRGCTLQGDCARHGAVAKYQTTERSFGLGPAMIRARPIHGYSRLRSARLVGDAMIPYPCGRLTQCRTCRPQALPTASPSAATDASPHRRRSRAWLSVAPALLALLGNLLTACALSPYPPFDSRQVDPPCTSRDAPYKRMLKNSVV